MQVRRFRRSGDGYAARHNHAEGQLFVLVEGACTLRTGAGEWLVTSERPCWIAPHQDHAVTTRGPVAGTSVLLDEAACGALPVRPGLLRANPLLIAVVDRLAGQGTERERQAHLCAVLLDEIAASQSDDLVLPMPQWPSLRAVAAAVAHRPDDATTLANWARSSALSKRTFTRRFQAETGLSFGAWRRRARLARALDLLAAGRGVTQVALDVGYESVGPSRRCSKRPLAFHHASLRATLARTARSHSTRTAVVPTSLTELSPIWIATMVTRPKAYHRVFD